MTEGKGSGPFVRSPQFENVQSGVSSTEDMIVSVPYLHNTETKLLLQVKKDLDRHEGYREYAYPDPLSKLMQRFPRERWGFVPAREILQKIGVEPEDAAKLGAPWTVGHGFTGGTTLDSRMGRTISERKLEEKILEEHGKLKAALPWYADASFVVHTILINMAFNMGLKGLLGFRNTLAYIKAKQYAQAAANMRKSKWYQQVPNRASELARRMETQEIPVQFKAPEKIQ